MSQIKPCPFCGGIGEECCDDEYCDCYFIKCKSCDAQGPLMVADNGIIEVMAKKQAIQEWNKRI